MIIWHGTKTNPEVKKGSSEVNGSPSAGWYEELTAVMAMMSRLKRSRARVMRSGVFAAEHKQWLDRQFHLHREELKKLFELHRKGDVHGEARATARVLRSFAGRACAIIGLYLEKKEPELQVPLTRKRFEEIVNSFSLFEPLPGKAKLVLLPKSGGDKRPTLKFGWQVKASHRLIRDVLEAEGMTNPYEYNRSNRGRDRAGSSVQDFIESGYRHWIIADLKDCYSSIKPKHLKWLGLPPRVIRHSVFANAELPIDCHDDQSGYLKAARHGLAQGAMLSGIIASGLVGRVLRTLSGDIGVRSYVDDIAICARSPAVTATIRNAVESGFTQLEAGPLTFKYLEVATAEAGFSFLNYRFKLEQDGGNETVHIHPDLAAFKNFKQRIYGILDDIPGKKGRDRVYLYAERWRKSQKLWNANGYAKSNFDGSVEIMISDHGTISQLSHKPILSCIQSAH